VKPTAETLIVHRMLWPASVEVLLRLISFQFHKIKLAPGQNGTSSSSSRVDAETSGHANPITPRKRSIEYERRVHYVHVYKHYYLVYINLFHPIKTVLFASERRMEQSGLLTFPPPPPPPLSVQQKSRSGRSQKSAEGGGRSTKARGSVEGGGRGYGAGRYMGLIITLRP
jgi:uncharacterized membrane protein YgcG